MLHMSNDGVSSLFSTMDRASHPGWLFPDATTWKRAAVWAALQQAGCKEEAAFALSVPACWHKWFGFAGVCVCVCLCVFAFETKKSTLRISLNVSSCEHPSLPLRNVTDGTKRIWEDTEWQARARQEDKGRGRLEGECEDQRILVYTLWHALQLMREARGQLLTTQR